ncbi:hypothetical protein IWQ60_010228 [Tieghemiomyces parasiticus]|uniref:N-acetyltransferase domain-containing protein n=1 Tax=Tieghemiomyces parasiticus TaxID=78921 RepID=A0A9W7ZM46_9FUNG|nr:hypothetical protein IWQ60_010228 [Tieghemiomyces parasiticus]
MHPTTPSCPTDDLVIRSIAHLDEFALCRQVRIQVFIEGQGFPLIIERDPQDATCHHMVALLPLETLATLHPPSSSIFVSSATTDTGTLLDDVTPKSTPVAFPTDLTDLASLTPGTAADFVYNGGRVTVTGEDGTVLVPVGTLRLYEYRPGVGKLGRVGVLPQCRGLRIGQRMMDAAHQVATRQFGWQKIRLHAQYDKVEFYLRCGYEVPDPTQFMEENFPHVAMFKDLASPADQGFI